MLTSANGEAPLARCASTVTVAKPKSRTKKGIFSTECGAGFEPIQWVPNR